MSDEHSAEIDTPSGGACEPCWNEAFRQSLLLGGSQVDHYLRLLDVLDGHPHALVTPPAVPQEATDADA